MLHDTIRLKQWVAATPSQVLAAFADPQARAQWSAPSESAGLEIDACDFRPGGAETARCGPLGDLRYSLDTRYFRVDDSGMVFSEAVQEDGQMLTLALITFRLSPDTSGCMIELTDQLVSFVGAGGVDGHRQGYAQSLGRLAAWVEGRPLAEARPAQVVVGGE